MSEPFAARKGDFVAHDDSRTARLLAFIATTVAVARYLRVLAVPFAFTPAGAAAFGASVAIQWMLAGFVEDQMDRLAMQFPSNIVPRIATGSPNVFVNGIEAVRCTVDVLDCQDHGRKRVEQGSEWVNINRKPAARWRDRTECNRGGFLFKNPAIVPENVIFGGPPTDYDNRYAGHALAAQLWPLFGIRGSGDAVDYIAGQITEKAIEVVWQ